MEIAVVTLYVLGCVQTREYLIVVKVYRSRKRLTFMPLLWPIVTTVFIALTVAQWVAKDRSEQ